MKKLTATLLVLALLLCAAWAETETESITLGFEDGFTIDLPAGWLYYPVDASMAQDGVLYRLSDADASHWLYIQSWNTDCADTDALKALIDRAGGAQDSGIYTFRGTDFVIYDLPSSDVSCCATLLDGRILNFVFTPQSDAEFMVLATQIVGSFAAMDAA